jgi:hypothetical protein
MTGLIVLTAIIIVIASALAALALHIEVKQ